MDDLSKILSKKQIKTPPEISHIKNYVQNEFEEDVDIAINGNTLVIGVNSAALASALRYKITELNKLTDKKLIIRISKY